MVLYFWALLWAVGKEKQGLLWSYTQEFYMTPPLAPTDVVPVYTQGGEGSYIVCHDIYQLATLQHKWWLGKVIRSKERCIFTKLGTRHSDWSGSFSSIRNLNVYRHLFIPILSLTWQHSPIPHLTNSTRLVCLTPKGHCSSSIFLTSSCSGELCITYHLAAVCQGEK